jgi:hypothetical protein
MTTAPWISRMAKCHNRHQRCFVLLLLPTPYASIDATCHHELVGNWKGLLICVWSVEAWLLTKMGGKIDLKAGVSGLQPAHISASRRINTTATRPLDRANSVRFDFVSVTRKKKNSSESNESNLFMTSVLASFSFLSSNFQITMVGFRIDFVRWTRGLSSFLILV